jgi:aminoglycoside phosphotransferase (APT) family kinase protein
MEREHEVSTDVALAKALVAAQFPQWSDLPVTQVDAVSTDNAMYRLGDRLAIRLPRRQSAEAPIAKEHAWLQRLALGLPAQIPLPVAKGQPANGYPYCWSIVQWLEGAPTAPGEALASVEVAQDLGRFVTALQLQDTHGAPLAGDHNHWRGAPLRAFDPEMRRRFASMRDLADIGDIIAAWDRDRAAAAWAGPAVWIHGDLKDGNLLMRDGALSGVLDWGLAGVGDPASDLGPGWSLFEGPARAAFRKTVAVDDATWARGRAWALIEGVLGLSYYRGREDVLAQAGRRLIDQVLADED